MPAPRITFLFTLLVLALGALSACSLFTPPVAIDDVPVYTGAQRIDPGQNTLAAAADRQAKQAIANGHKSEVRAFVLPEDTSPAQIKSFYVSKLTQLGGQVTIELADDAPMGSIFLEHGTQSVEISYDAMSESSPPVLLIESFIADGCPSRKGDCK